MSSCVKIVKYFQICKLERSWRMNSKMSFQFSQNLLADLQSSQSSQSSRAEMSASASQTAQTQPLLHSRNGSQQNTSQGSLHSQNLLGSQSQDVFPPPQHNIPQRPKFPRSQSSQSLGPASQPPPSFLASRVPYSRFNQTPASINISLAHSLKQVQRKLDDFPVQVAKMLEEGFDYLQTEAKKHSSRSRESSAEVCQVLDKIQTAAKEKNDRVKKVLEECAIELENYAEAIQSQKILQERSEEIMKTMNKVIVKQAAEIDRLKKEKDESKEALKIKSESKLPDTVRLLLPGELVKHAVSEGTK